MAFVAMIMFMFWGNRYCKDSIEEVEYRKKVYANRLLEIEQDGLASSSEAA